MFKVEGGWGGRKALISESLKSELDLHRERAKYRPSQSNANADQIDISKMVS